jgi:hypothetical protein
MQPTYTEFKRVADVDGVKYAVDLFKEETPVSNPELVDWISQYYDGRPADMVLEKLGLLTKRPEPPKPKNESASLPQVKTSIMTETVETCQEEDVLQAIVEVQIETPSWLDQQMAEIEAELAAIPEMPEGWVSTTTLDAPDRREAISKHLQDCGDSQTRRQIEVGAGYMYEGQRVSKEEHDRIKKQVLNDLGALEKQKVIRKITQKNPKHKPGQNDKLYLYELIQKETPVEVSPPVTDKDEIVQLILSAIEADTRDESNKILVGVLRKLMGS